MHILNVAETKTEIERKFRCAVRDPKKLVETLGRLGHGQLIEQYYVAVTPGVREERYRKVVECKAGGNLTTYYHTVKVGAGLEREEREERTSAREFLANKKASLGEILKQRYRVELRGFAKGDRFAEIDTYDSRPDKVVCEIEFASEEEARRFDWHADSLLKRLFLDMTEVTDDLRYKNETMALSGFPGGWGGDRA